MGSRCRLEDISRRGWSAGPGEAKGERVRRPVLEAGAAKTTSPPHSAGGQSFELARPPQGLSRSTASEP